MPNNNLAEAVRSSLITHNTETGHAWTFGTNWDNQGTQFETYVNKYLFPKLNESMSITAQGRDEYESKIWNIGGNN